jgi:hypothetical protein
MSFEGRREFLIEDHLGQDTLLGINGPFEDEKLNEVLAAVARCMESAEATIAQTPHSIPHTEL